MGAQQALEEEWLFCIVCGAHSEVKGLNQGEENLSCIIQRNLVTVLLGKVGRTHHLAHLN